MAIHWYQLLFQIINFAILFAGFEKVSLPADH